MYLNKISISNVRRFSEKVEIPIEKGATVFIAPNGTGKTAIFEAIELALTGKVRRLPPPPDALIRDSAEKSYVKLDFDSGNFCEVDFEKNSNPILKGSHQKLFGSVPIDDLPFLLRLTHLLNQRNSEWFVQMDQATAGGELDHLAIGRDANHVNNLVISAKRAATKAIEDASGQLAAAQAIYDQWRELVSRRSLNPSELQQNLIDRKLLRDRLIAPAKTVQHDQLNSINLEDLIAYHDVVRQLNARSLERSRERMVSFAEFKTIVSEYKAAIIRQKTAAENVEKSRASKAEIAGAIAKSNDEYLTFSNDLLKLQEDLLRHIAFRDLENKLIKITLDIERLQKLLGEHHSNQKSEGESASNLKKIWLTQHVLLNFTGPSVSLEIESANKELYTGRMTSPFRIGANVLTS